nr:hypothetical protein [Tanacetum cinerariifolium]
MRRIGKGFLGVETPLFEGMLVVREDVEADIGEEQIPDDTAIAAAQEVVTTAVLEEVLVDSIPSPAPPTLPPQSSQDIASTSQAQSPPQQPQSPTPAQPQEAQTLEITWLNKRVKKLERVNKVKTFTLRRLKKVRTSQRVETSDDTIMEDTKEVKDIVDNAQVEERQAEKQAEIYQIDMDHPLKVLSMQEDDSKVQEVVDVVTTAKLITKVVNAANTPVSAASIIIPTAKPNIPAVTITAAPVKVDAASTRRRRGVVIRDPEKESSAKTSDETKSKDKGKGILVEEPKPMKKKQQVEMDEAYARKLHEELNQLLMRNHLLKLLMKPSPRTRVKKRPQTEAQAQRNMIMYLKNTAGFKLDYFKGKSYDDIRLIFKAMFNTNMEFLLKSKEKIEEEENRALESINETPAQKAAKKRRLNQEDKDVEEIKQHLEIVPDEDDDVYTEATPLARKVPVVDYQVILLNNKPRYKIIKADGTHQLYTSFITMWKNFDRDDLKTLWSIVKERFSTSKPNNFSDEYLLTTLRTMFRSQMDKTMYGRVKEVTMVKKWLKARSC